MLVERKWFGGSCPNIPCLPSKNLIYSAKVASLAKRGAEFGVEMDSFRINTGGVQRGKRVMVEGLPQMHVERHAASGAELSMGEGRFVAPRTVEVALNEGGPVRPGAVESLNGIVRSGVIREGAEEDEDPEIAETTSATCLECRCSPENQLASP